MGSCGLVNWQCPCRWGWNFVLRVVAGQLIYVDFSLGGKKIRIINAMLKNMLLFEVGDVWNFLMSCLDVSPLHAQLL